MDKETVLILIRVLGERFREQGNNEALEMLDKMEQSVMSDKPVMVFESTEWKPA